MNKNKKIIIGILIVVLIVIGAIVAYKAIEKSVSNRANLNLTVENISSTIVNTVNNEQNGEEFEILFYDKHPMENYKIYTILDKSETDKYDYTIYGYNGSVNIRIEGKDYSLKEALLENKITMEEIIARASKDLKEKNITGDMYQDGGSMIYKYNNYTIIKCHTLDGNSDVYIGSKDMTINDLGI